MPLIWDICLPERPGWHFVELPLALWLKHHGHKCQAENMYLCVLKWTLEKYIKLFPSAWQQYTCQTAVRLLLKASLSLGQNPSHCFSLSLSGTRDLRDGTLSNRTLISISSFLVDIWRSGWGIILCPFKGERGSVLLSPGCPLSVPFPWHMVSIPCVSGQHQMPLKSKHTKKWRHPTVCYFQF